MTSRFLDRWAAMRTAVLGGGVARRVARGMDDVQSSGSGAVGITGLLSGTLGGLLAVAAGTVGIAGTVSASLGAMTMDAAGTVDVPDSVSFSVPPANYLEGEHTARTMGRNAAHLALHYVLLGAGHYIWWDHATTPDPGADLGSGSSLVAALAARTGIRVPLAAGAHTAETNATAIAAAVSAVSGLSGLSSGSTVTVVGVTTFSAGPTTFASRGRQGIVGTPDNRAFDDLSFATNGLIVMALDSSRWGEVPIVLTGVAVGIGTQHTSSVVFGVWQQTDLAEPDTETDGAVFRGLLGVTSGAGTNVVERIASAGVYVDPALGTIWVGAMTPTGENRLMITYASRPGTTGHDWIETGGNRLRNITSPPNSSDPADLPAVLGPNQNPASGMLALQISFVDATSFQSDVRPGFDFGTLAGLAAGERDTSFTFPTTFSGPFVSGNRYTVPSDMRGLEIYSAAVNYAVHVLGEDFGAHVCLGPTAAGNDWSGGVVHGIGAVTGVTGTEIGWVEVLAPAGIAIAPGADFFLLEESPEGSSTAGTYDTTLTADVFEADVWGDAFMYQGAATEAGYDPLSSVFIDPGEETTNLDYDASTYGVGVGQTEPVVIEPNGLLLNGGNNASIRASAITVGFGAV